MTAYGALLRGVNLGNTNKVSMSDLRALFIDLGHTDAATYLQSGNVVFTSTGRDAAKLTRDIGARLRNDLSLDVQVLLRSHDELARVVAANPYQARESDHTRLLVTFLAQPAADPGRLEVPTGETGVFSIVDREVYLHVPDGYGRSKLTNAYIERRLGVPATTRNWKTVGKLCEMTG